jgi:hypothetical protein
MRGELRGLGAPLVSFVVACGGSVVSVRPDDAGTNGDATMADGGVANDAAPADVDLDAPATCDELAKEVAALTQEATTCCLMCKSVQCTQVARGPCCEITVQDGDRGQTLTALAAKYVAQCRPVCPALPCPAAPSSKCNPTTSQCE